AEDGIRDRNVTGVQTCALPISMAYHRQQGVDTCIARIFNTFGPRMRPHDGRAIPTFLRQALAGAPITVFGEGKQTRSFCYVDDRSEERRVGKECRERTSADRGT